MEMLTTLIVGGRGDFWGAMAMLTNLIVGRVSQAHTCQNSSHCMLKTVPFLVSQLSRSKAIKEDPRRSLPDL